jgi:hypothetical protein
MTLEIAEKLLNELYAIRTANEEFISESKYLF